ncbi:uncharacterized protein LOC135160473 isoform X2 [Diachasmimorpha longicaudata]|uniref:uncharacterized protein LOC135160473 isoform X2 n=1 Tax=Diachasmimorpha longicaudata TaxID=58733 RepID=UPI0030B87E3A
MSKQLSKGSIAPHLQFEYYFGGDVLILQCLGLYSMGSLFKTTEPSFNLWELPPFVCGLTILFYGVSADFFNVIVEARQYSWFAIEILAIVLCASLGTYKGYRLWVYRREFYNFIEAVHVRWDEEVAENTITERMVEAAKSIRLFRTWYGTVVAAIFGSYIIRPYVAYSLFKLSGGNDTFDFTQTVYPSVHPFLLTTPQSFFCYVVMETIGVIFCTLYWTAVDGLFAQLTTQLAIQFQRLSKQEWAMAGKIVILTTGITAQTMMFCMCAQRLNDEVAGVRQAAYNCSWTEFDSTIKNLLLLIMIQTEPEFIYAAYGFVYLNKPQMTVIFTAAMRFFTLLRNMT